jgi:hypothetical protein
MVFVSRNRREKVEEDYNVAATMQKRVIKGKVGIEIEVEGKKLPKEADSPKPWVYHVDGSLRGAENAEYVLDKPIEFDAVPHVVNKLWDAFRSKGSTLDESNRTSVHIHLNVQEFHANRLTSFMALWFVFEEILTEWCGDHRVGNLFCLRAKDAPSIISQLRRFIRSGMRTSLREGLHYAGMNAHAIVKFGSLEIRTLRGVSDPDIINTWVAILRRLYDLSADFPDPREICGGFSGTGADAFFEYVLADNAATVRQGIKMDSEGIRTSMYEGVRMAQDLCYARDWSTFNPKELKIDPFGRKPRVENGFDIEAALGHIDQVHGNDSMFQAALAQAQAAHAQPIPMTLNGFAQMVNAAPVATEEDWLAPMPFTEEEEYEGEIED